MNICFYAAGPKSGLDNNGGSNTILRSANMLRKLGHSVEVCATYDRFTWFDHPKVVSNPSTARDALIAVSANDVKNACKLNGPVFWWVRGWETWQMPEEKLFERARMVDQVIVNSAWLYKHMKRHGIDCELCYAGLDPELWEFNKHAGSNKRIRTGILYHKFHKTKGYHTSVKITENMWNKRWKVHTLGKSPWIVEPRYAPVRNYRMMLEFYNNCDIYLSATTSEGFHNIPAEAALCGCAIVANRHPRNGMGYATEETAMLYNTIKEGRQYIRRPDYSKINRMREYLLDIIGTREKNMRRLIEICR